MTLVAKVCIFLIYFCPFLSYFESVIDSSCTEQDIEVAFLNGFFSKHGYLRLVLRLYAPGRLPDE